MATNHNSEEIIASALSLPEEQRLAVMDAIHASLADRSIDHGSEEAVADVEAAWKDEIARRLEDISSGRVKTIPAEEAERAIRENASPI